MVNLKQILFSLLLPISATIVIPLILYLFIDISTSGVLFNPNLILLIMGIVLSIFGFYLFIKCNLVFIKIGKGTLMPLTSIQTKHLIIAGPYRYVRNPMILAVWFIILGEAFIFASFSILTWAISFLIINLVYMPLIEEKGMEKRFGMEFIEYKNNVRGWIPHFQPYELKTE